MDILSISLKLIVKQIPDLANKFNINGYPTIKLVKGNQIIEFDSKPEVKTLETFLSTVLAN